MATGVSVGNPFDTEWADRKEGMPSVKPPIGIFGEFSGATPKYARNVGGEDRDFRASMARLFIQLGPDEFDTFIDSLPPESQPLARVLAGTNVAIGGSQGGAGYVDFLLQNATQHLQEKTSVVETLGDNYVSYFFGHEPPTFSYSGILVNSYQDDQAMNMLRIYKDIIRGSQLARRNKVVRLRYDSVIVAGAAMSLGWSLNSDNEMTVPFSLQILVKSITILPNNDYGLVSVNDVFAADEVLPKPTGVNLERTKVRPVKLTVAPPFRRNTPLETLESSTNPTK